MIEPNDISHVLAPLTLHAKGCNSTTSLRSTTKCQLDDIFASNAAQCAVSASVPPTIWNSTATVGHADKSNSPSSYQFVGHGEAAAIVPASSHAVAAAAGDAS